MKTKFSLLFYLFFASHFVSFAQSALYPNNGTLYDGKIHKVALLMHPDSVVALFNPANRWTNHSFPATFIYDDVDTLYNVGVRIKGNSSRNAKRLSIKISTDEYINQHFQGLKTFNLNGEHNDPSLMREYLACYVMNKAGNSANRAGLVKLYINGVYYGLRGNIEHVNKKFVETHLGNNQGNLYKCSWPAELTWMGSDQNAYKNLINPSPLNERAYELKTNESADDYSDLVNFIRVINLSPTDSFNIKIEQVFEVKAYLRTLATEILIGHWDNYFANKNNYFLYQNTSTKKFTYIPYDMDNSFGIQWGYPNIDTRNVNNWGNLGASSSPLTHKILAVPQFRAYFNRQLKNLCDSVFNSSLFDVIDTLKASMDDAVKTDSFYTQNWESDYGYTYTDWLNSITESLGAHASIGLKPYINNRRSSALAQVILSGINETEKDKIVFYPNPSSGKITIRNTENSSITLRICTLNGSLVFSEDIPEHTEQELDLQHLEKGVYLVLFQSEERFISPKKLVFSR